MSSGRIQQHCTVALLATALVVPAGWTGNLFAQKNTSVQASAEHLPARSSAVHPSALLSPDELQKIIPATVFFRGQSSTVQYRNAGGIRFAGGEILFAVKVDTGGYASSIQERYQDYLVSEVPIQFGSHILPPGAYGVGFVGANFLVLDLGGHTIFSVPATTDASLHRPRPLQLLVVPNDQAYRLYSGKQYAEFVPNAAP